MLPTGLTSTFSSRTPSGLPMNSKGCVLVSLAVEIVAVGTELLLGQLHDTNTLFIAQHCADAGIDVLGTHTIGDNRSRIANVLRAALERVEGVITTGGLGPTVDDLTKEAVCDALSLDTELHAPSLAQMQDFFA